MHIRISLIYLLIFALVGCSVQEDKIENLDNEENAYQVDFKTHALQGVIEGEAVNFVYGNIAGTTQEYFCYVHDTINNDSCLVDRGRTHFDVLFSLSREELKPAYYELFLNLNNLEGRTVTLVKTENAQSQNIVCTEGALEILSVDTIARVVEARLDAYSDDNNYVNGNFSMKYCL